MKVKLKNLKLEPSNPKKMKAKSRKEKLQPGEESSAEQVEADGAVTATSPRPEKNKGKSKRKSKADEQVSDPACLEYVVNGDVIDGRRTGWAEFSDDKKGAVSDREEEDGEARVAAEESDSSEDEVADRNTVGNVPLEWYKEEEHIGYDIAGKKIKKQARKDRIDSYLDVADNPQNWRKIYDEYNDEVIELTKEEIKQIENLLKGRTVHANADPYEPYVDWFHCIDKDHPISNAPEPKRRFVPSKWEQKKVVKYVRAIRKGWIKFDKPKVEPRFYLLWGDDSSSAENERRALSYIPPPKAKLPGHEESYNPSMEYIPTQEEINSYELMYEEDRPNFIPRRYESLRSVPAYENAFNEANERFLDLYLCPRARKKRIDIDPESLKPKLPNKKDLMPYPFTCYLEYKGHTGPVTSISVDVYGQRIASGSTDGTACVWEVDTGRCLKVWAVGEAVNHVAWNPSPELSIIAVTVGYGVLLLDTGLGHPEQLAKNKDLLHLDSAIMNNDGEKSGSCVSWHRHDKFEGILLKHFKAVAAIEWHRKGDYFCTLVPRGESRAILIHQLSKKVSHNPWKRLHGLPVATVFHPRHSFFFISTKKNVRVYDLLKEKLVKKLETGLREVSSIAIHPAGDNVIVGSKEGKLCWFDMDLSSRPYKTLSSHDQDINKVAFHNSYPLFASCSEDGTAFVFHGMVYSDLNENPLIVPLKVLRGHTIANGRGVMDCKFHPRQPWLFTAGSDSLIKLYCN